MNELKPESAVGSTGLLCDPPEDCRLVAVLDGTGESASWGLYVEDADGETVAMLKWPEGWPERVTAQHLQDCGFDISVA